MDVTIRPILKQRAQSYDTIQVDNSRDIYADQVLRNVGVKWKRNQIHHNCKLYRLMDYGTTY